MNLESTSGFLNSAPSRRNGVNRDSHSRFSVLGSSKLQYCEGRESMCNPDALFTCSPSCRRLIVIFGGTGSAARFQGHVQPNGICKTSSWPKSFFLG